jgi:hypothetical protein
MMKELEDSNERAANEFSRKMRWAYTHNFWYKPAYTKNYLKRKPCQKTRYYLKMRIFKGLWRSWVEIFK